MTVPQGVLDSHFAETAARRAGALLLHLRANSGETGKALGAAGDRESNELLLEMIADEYPDDAVLSEESADSPVRLAADRVWIIDPLDGTREYAIPGRDDWAVHVALWERGQGITAAAVALPALDVTYYTDEFTPQRALAARRRFLVSDSRPPAWAAPVAAALDADLVPMGSAGAKAMAVLRGDAEAYLHSGGQWEWDSAAPVGVVLAAGLHASRIDGSPLEYNLPHPYLPDLLICRPELAEPLLREIAAAPPAP